MPERSKLRTRTQKSIKCVRACVRAKVHVCGIGGLGLADYMGLINFGHGPRPTTTPQDTPDQFLPEWSNPNGTLSDKEVAEVD